MTAPAERIYWRNVFRGVDGAPEYSRVECVSLKDAYEMAEHYEAAGLAGEHLGVVRVRVTEHPYVRRLQVRSFMHHPDFIDDD